MSRILQELKRRKVFRVAGVYAVTAWLAIQVIDVVLPTFDAPQWVNQTLMLLILVGFPVTLLLTWAFDITADGIQKTEPALPNQLSSLRKRDYAFAVSILLLVGLVGAQQFGNFSSDNDAAVITEKSVAVLPFVAMSSGPDDGYFADGLTEELLNVLAQIPDLKVPGRTSSFYYKGQNQDLREIGEALGVAHILEGSVRRAANTLRITAQLVDADTGFHIWSATFDRSSDDIFDIQDEIARAVTDVLRVQLFGADNTSQMAYGTSNADAQNLYLIAMARYREQVRGNVQSNPEPIGRTRAMFEEVTRLDPNFADAWAGLTQSLLLLSREGLTEGSGILLEQNTGLELARSALLRAQELAPNAPVTLLATAAVNHRAFDMGPNAGAGTTMESVLDDYQRALEAAPEHPDVLEGLAELHRSRRNYAEAIRLYDRILAVDPLSSAMLNRGIALRDSSPELARRQIKQVGDLHPDMQWKSALGALELQLGHLHHAALYYEADKRNVFLPSLLFSLGDVTGAEKILDNSFGVQGGDLGELSAWQSLLYRRDYAAAIALAEESYNPTRLPPRLISASLLDARFKLRHFEAIVQTHQQRQASVGRDLNSFLSTVQSTQIGVTIELAHALQMTGDTTTATAYRERVRELMTNSYDSNRSTRDNRLLHETNLLLLASEGRVDEALTEMEAMVAAGWRLLVGWNGNLIGHYLVSNSFYWFEDNPILDSIRDEPRFIAALDFVKAENAKMLAELQAGLTLADIADER